MKAITLHQPWASMIACGLKQVESRGWTTRYRGPLLVHAGKELGFGSGHAGHYALMDYFTLDRDGAKAMRALADHLGIEERSSYQRAQQVIAQLPRGAVVAGTNLTDDLHGSVVAAQRPDQALWCDLESGPERRGFVLEGTVACPTPVTGVRGYQQLWNPDSELVGRFEDVMAETEWTGPPS